MKKFIDRRDFARTSGLGAAGLLLHGLPGVGSASGERPNILWLVSEDNSPWLGCYGDDFATTPNLDKLAEQGVLFENAFANAPVCAPARFTLHTGVYASSAGTLHMRSINPIPGHIRFFTHYLREAGYFCVNGNKTDYNTTGTPKGAWDDRRFTASLKGLKKRQPFFCFINYMVSHESSLHKTKKETKHDPSKIKLAPYHPDTPEIRHDYAQYYDQLEKLDSQIGKILDDLEISGLAENTIVFYFADHGGILPRSKKFMYETGIRVPLIIRIPEKYRRLSRQGPGTRNDRMVSFIDFAPTVLGLAGLMVPEYMQGRAFLGEKAAPPPEYVYAALGRIDERYDMCRTVVDKNFQYIRNYMPHQPYGRHQWYLWKMPAVRSWEEEFKAGRTDEVQGRFFKPKPTEELYDMDADPWGVNNLVDDPKYRKTLDRMRETNRNFLLETRDPGFLHEAEMVIRSEGSTPYEIARDEKKYDLERIMTAAQVAGERDPDKVVKLIQFLQDDDSGVRYWGAVGCSALEEKAAPAQESLKKALGDSSPNVRIAAAEALCKLGRCEEALPVLEEALSHENIWVGLHASDALYNVEEITGPVFEKKREKAVKKVRNVTTLNALR